jgi:hypothetical protein
VLTSGLEEDGTDPLKEARAFNQSILFMMSVPYVICGIAGILIYRGLRRQKVEGPVGAE